MSALLCCKVILYGWFYNTIVAQKQIRRSRRIRKKKERNLDGLKNVSHLVKTTSSDELEQSPVLPKSAMLISPKTKNNVKNLLDARGIWVEEQLRGMNVNQLLGIAKEIDINTTKEMNRHDLQKQIIWRLEWLG